MEENMETTALFRVKGFRLYLYNPSYLQLYRFYLLFWGFLPLHRK